MLTLKSSEVFRTSVGDGNQEKYWSEDGRFLYKINTKYREASKEISAYVLASAFGLPCARYELEEVVLSDVRRVAVKSENFLGYGDSWITMYKVIQAYTPSYNTPAIDIMNSVVSIVKSSYGVDCEFFLYCMVVFDFLIANPDRHYSNFGVIHNDFIGKNRVAPLFDHGQAFFRTDAQLTTGQYENEYRKLKVLPFSRNPVKNLCDHVKARQAFLYMMNNCGWEVGVRSLRIQDGHKLTVLRQIEKIHKILGV